MLDITGHKLHLNLLHKAVLTEVDRVWCYRSQSDPWLLHKAVLTEVEKAWCYRSVCTLGSCSMLNLQRWTRFCVTNCTLDYCSRLYLQKWTRFRVTTCTLDYCSRLYMYLQRWTRLVLQVSLYPWLLLQVKLTEIKRVWCNESQSVHLITVLGCSRLWCLVYTNRG